MAKKSNLEFFIEGALKSTKLTRSDLQRSRNLLNNAISNPCCEVDNPVLNIAGPTGLIGTGANAYNYTITSSVSGVPDSEVENITLYMNDLFVAVQDGNAFSFNQTKSPEIPAEENVYYTVAVLKNGQTIVSPVLQFTLTEAAPFWTFVQQQQIAQTEQTRHIVDVLYDINPDTLSVTFIDLPSFCTAALIPVTGLTVNNEVKNALIVDITVTPGALDIGTYNFTMRGSDGVLNVDKVVSLLTNTSLHTRATVRPPTSVTVNDTDGAQSVGVATMNQGFNVQNQDTKPQVPGFGLYSVPINVTNVPITLTPTVGVLGKWITVLNMRKSTTGTGNRYEETWYQILTIT